MQIEKGGQSRFIQSLKVISGEKSNLGVIGDEGIKKPRLMDEISSRNASKRKDRLELSVHVSRQGSTRNISQATAEIQMKKTQENTQRAAEIKARFEQAARANAQQRRMKHSEVSTKPLLQEFKANIKSADPMAQPPPEAAQKSSSSAKALPDWQHEKSGGGSSANSMDVMG